MSNSIFKNERIVKALLEATPDMLTILDKDGKIMECNQHFIDSFGYDRSEAIGKIGPIDMVSEKDREKAVSAFNELITNSIVLNIRLETMRKDNSTFSSIWSGARLSDDIGKVEGFLITGKDLSHIQKLEDELKKEKDQKLILIGNMTARIAHDLRNPLTIIINGISLLEIKLQQLHDEKITNNLTSIIKAAERMKHQLEDLMDYVSSRPLNLSECSVVYLIESSIENIIIPGNIQVKYAKDSDANIICDKNQLVIVFSNLILNSIQEIGKDDGTISVDWKINKEHITIKFIDSGHGIPKDVLDKIFEPFFTTKQSGTGLGLVSCKKIIEQHNGKISANNNPTTFTIILPTRTK